jgi:hypothetical protein
MINKIEGSLLSLSAALHIGAQGVANGDQEQLLKGISQIFFGGALLLRGNRSEKMRFGLMATGAAIISLGLFNTYLATQTTQPLTLTDKWNITVSEETKPLILSDSWNITVSEPLHRLFDDFKHLPIAKETALPIEEFRSVGWDHYAIHSIREKRLDTSHLAPCIGLATRGFDESGKLTHIGLAHSFLNKKMPGTYFEELRKIIKGRIELFIAGGGRESDSNLRDIYALAMEHRITILHDVSQRFYKSFKLPVKGMLYRAISGINQIYFDKLFNLQLYADVDVLGLPIKHIE